MLVLPNLTVLLLQIVRFKDKETHQIFLEPEGRTVPELYVQVSFIYQVYSCFSRRPGFFQTLEFPQAHDDHVYLA